MYKTILVHVDGGALQDSRLRAAAILARSQGAHLVGCACTGVSWFDAALWAGTSGAPRPLVDFCGLREAAAARLRGFETEARRLGLDSVESRLADDVPETSLERQSRYADLIVLSQESGQQAAAAPRRLRKLPERLGLHCPRPILVVPAGYRDLPIASRIVVGWDGGLQALHAIAAAIPLLAAADSVQLAIVNPGALTGRHGEEPGADMALYLARHGVEVDVVSERTAATTGEALIALARNGNAGLIVAGIFGHGRYREWILGGASRELLARTPVPLLMAH